MTILDALHDPALFVPIFSGPSWAAWEAFLAAVFGLPMTPDQLAAYRRHTGRVTPPTTHARRYGHAPGAGAFLRFVLVASFSTSLPPDWAQ